MATRSRTSNGPANSSTALGFEATLRFGTDELRNNTDASEYKHVVSGLTFHIPIFESFGEHRTTPGT